MSREDVGSHPLPGLPFTYYDDLEVLGVHHIGLTHDSGSRVVMPADTVYSIGDNLAIAEVIDQVASYAADHNGYHLPDDIIRTQPVTLLKQAHTNEHQFISNRASVYRAAEASAVIKAFDKTTTKESTAQYAVMSGLYKELIGKLDDAVHFSSPEQYAIIQPPKGKHHTIVMEAVDGVELVQVERDMTDTPTGYSRALIHLAALVRDELNDALTRQLSTELRPYINDVTGRDNNTLIPTAPSDTPKTPAEILAMLGEVTIIDQPKSAVSVSRFRQSRDGFPRIERLLNRLG